MKYVFDLDNTLIYTSELNNESYNYSLEFHGFERIESNKRITRKHIREKYDHISNDKIESIIITKQEYFINNIHKTYRNEELFELLNKIEKNNSIIWTSADKKRVLEILKHYQIEDKFYKIIYSEKINIEKDINKIEELFKTSSENIIFYEDDTRIFKELTKNDINVKLIKFRPLN